MTDALGNGPTTSEILTFQTAAIADAQAPVISSVVATPLETSAIITWTTDEIADGVVKYGTDAADLSGNIGDIESITDHRIIISNLTASTDYTFLVQSTDRTGNGPAQSEQITFTTQATGAAQGPTAPAGLTARAGNGAIQLAWAAPATDATSLVLQRAEGDGAFAPITTLDIVTGFLDNNVQNGTAYRYQLSANGIQGAGSPSTATEAVTPSEISGPSAPSLSAIQGTKTSPTLVVNNSTPVAEGGALTYTFQLSTASDFSDVVTSETVVSGAGRGASDPANITLYTVDRALDDGSTYYYRVKANDGFSDSPFLSGSFTLNASAPAYPGDFNGDLAVGFPDFLTFVGTFNKKLGDDGYNGDADFNGDGAVGFPDFISFVGLFNKVYVQGASGKPVVAVPFDTDTQAQFSLNGHFVQNQTGRKLAVDVQLKDVTDLKGYGIQVNYDPTVLEFVDATDTGDTFLKSGDRAADLFAVLDHNQETGQLYIASAVTQGNPVSGAGTLGTLTFRLLDPSPQNADIHIAQGILFNPALDGFVVANLGDRFSIIPTEYALDHNFPNPFNPETTLRYAIPAADKVTLSIYNILGQEVIRLVDAEQTAGFYAIS
jgi:chitodextrinase